MAGSDEMTRIALQRFGLGARPETRMRISGDLRAAVLAEINPGKAVFPQGDLPGTSRGIQIISEVEEKRRSMRAANRQAAQAFANPAGPDPANGMQASGMSPLPGVPEKPLQTVATPVQRAPDLDSIRIRDVMLAEAKARIEHGVAAEVGFAERWVDFWANHFCVAVRRGQILQGITGAYEREAIRAHAFGKFVDMLVAVEMHPAMLHYLDQRQSIGPGSPAGQRRKRGLNENLAREILELHTLGVGGGYSQGDVTGFAKILTGWSISNNEENLDGYGGYFFAPNRHEPGAQTVLGKSYNQPGKEQGVAVLHDLARHPATARFIAGKIVRHFVADAPPPALVAKLEHEFRRTNGDLAALARVLVESDESWTIPQTKLRTPYEFLIATLRATGEAVDRVPPLLNALNLMGQPLWNPTGPNGHPDDAAALLAPKAIKTRLEFSMQAGRRLGGRIDPRELAQTLYGEALHAETKQAIARAETRPQGIAILLMSPEFQRR